MLSSWSARLSTWLSGTVPISTSGSSTSIAELSPMVLGPGSLQVSGPGFLFAGGSVLVSASLSESLSHSVRFGMGRVSASGFAVVPGFVSGLVSAFVSGVVPGLVSAFVSGFVSGAVFDFVSGFVSGGGGTVAGPGGSSRVSGTITWLLAVRSISHRCRGRRPGSGPWTSWPIMPPSFWWTPEFVSCCWKTRLESLYSSGIPR
jgi:hypothetical protein